MVKLNFHTTAFFILLMFTLLTGCGSREGLFYLPNRNPTPLFKNKGDIFFDGSAGIIRSELTAGCAVTKSIGIYGGISGAVNRQTTNAIILRPETYTIYRFNNHNKYFGIGYFLNQDLSPNFRFEIFGDYAEGRFFNSNTVGYNSSPYVPSKDFNLDGTFKRIGFMPNIGYNNPRTLRSIAYSARFSQITFSNLNYNSATYWEKELNGIHTKTRHNLVEHTLTFRGREVKENINYQICIGVSHYIPLEYYQYQQFNFSIMFGIFVNTNIFGRTGQINRDDQIPVTR